MIPVYDKNGDVVARVKYNDNLDVWGGRNYANGGIGLHKGLTRLKKTKQFVLILGTQWEGKKDYAEIISDERARQEILRAGNEELLNKYFPDDKDGDEEE